MYGTTTTTGRNYMRPMLVATFMKSFPDEEAAWVLFEILRWGVFLEVRTKGCQRWCHPYK